MTKMDWRRARHKGPPVSPMKVSHRWLRQRAQRHAAAVLFRSMKRRLLRTLPAGTGPSERQVAAESHAIACHAERVELKRDLVLAHWQAPPHREVTASLKAFGFKCLSGHEGYRELLGGGNWWYYDCAEPLGGVAPSPRPPIRRLRPRALASQRGLNDAAPEFRKGLR